MRQQIHVNNGPRVMSADGSQMKATLHGILPLSTALSDNAQSAFALNDLKTGTLISLSQLCDDDCIAVFNKYNVQIVKNDQIIITGKRLDNGLWSIPITPPATHQANGILRLDKPKTELAQYFHATLGSPVPSTLIRAIRRGHLTTWPGLTTQLISKHLPKSIATTLGHQDQEAKNIRSTKNTTQKNIFPVDEKEMLEDLSPSLEPRTHQLCAMLFDKSEILTSYSDQTGRFHIPSSRGNNYIFVLYNRDTNSIHAVAIPNRQAANIRDAWEKTHKLLVHQGHPPELHILDNECSQSLKDAFAKHHVAFQRVPPKEHRVNAAERAIRTFKNHFVAILCTVDSRFPLSEWDRLLPQAELTINLLRSSRIHPSLSAYASLHGNFDFNRTPVAPPGTRIVAHVAADTRTSFGQHGKVGWYIGPSPEHYRCYKCYFEDTGSERDVLKVDFFPEKIPFPSVSPTDYLKQTAEDMLHLLRQPPASDLHKPLHFGAPILNAFTQVADILGRAIQLPSTPTPPPTILTSPLPVPLTRVNPPTPPLTTQSPPAQSSVSLPRRPVTPPRVVSPIPPPMSVFTPIPDIESPPPPKTTTPDAPLRVSPRTRPSRLHFDPRTHQKISLAQALLQYDPSIPGKMINPTTGRPETMDTLLAGPDSETWRRSLTNEWARCMQGITKNRPTHEHIAGNNTMFFILPNDVPRGRKVTYANFVCTMRPGKAEPMRVRMTVGGDRLDAFQDVRSPAIGLTDTKLHLNSVISDAHKGARYCTADIKDFFLGSEMKQFQYMKIHKKYVTPDIMEAYNLTDAHFDSKGFAYVEIRKGMYGLKEAAILAYEQLKEHLATFGYFPVSHTPGLWRHSSRPTTFTLAVDDFGIKFFTKADADHLFDAIATKYVLTKDWSGTSYLGFTIKWNYDEGWVDISMPDYVHKALKLLQHPLPLKPQHAPHRWTAPAYGQKVQLADEDLTPLLSQAGIRRVQQVTGLFLYYSRGCDPTIAVALNEISTSQAAPTRKTEEACNMLLDYLATHPNATIRYHASDMVLAVISDAAYLVLPKARSRAAGHFFLTTLPSATSSPPNPKPNGAIQVLCKTLRGVKASAAEAETAGLFLNAQEAIPLITALEEMGHKQPPSGTPLETDNSTAHGILQAKVRMKRSKAFDMRYYWLKDRIAQKQFNLYWAPGKLNSADYFTKHYPPSHHKLMRYLYLQKPTSQVRGCVTPTGIATSTSGLLYPHSTSPMRAILLERQLRSPPVNTH
jgi:hypothetical protein